MSGYEDERKSHSRSPLDDISRDSRLIALSRPFTAKKLENDTQKIPKKSFGRYNTGLKPKKFLAKDRNSPLISKMKPKKVSVDKERLYIENMELKLKNNELVKTLTKYKARIIQLERDKSKKSESVINENPSNTSFLVSLLKQTIKDLKSELLNKENELSSYKKNLKYTKIVEMELEIKAYIDECTRLKHHLEGVLEAENDVMSTDYSQKDKIQNLLKTIDDNQKEIQKLKDQARVDKTRGERSPKFKEEQKKYSKEINTLKETLEKHSKEHQEETAKLKKDLAEERTKNINFAFKLKESDKLIENLYSELKFTRQKKTSRFLPPKCLQVLSNLSASKNLPTDEYLKQLCQNNTLSFSQLLNALQDFDKTVKPEDLEKIMKYIQGTTQEEIFIDRLVKFFNTFDFTLPDPTQETQPSEKILHFKYRMQLHRIQKSNFFQSLFSSSSKSLHLQELVLTLTKPPFNFPRPDSQELASIIFGPHKNLSFSDFVQNFEQKIGDWEVFTQQDEESFDTFLVTVVSENEKNLQEICESLDSDEKGIISLAEFQDCIDSLKIKIPERVQKYLLVLFYSNNMELDQVPYKQFLQAYTTGEQKAEEEDVKEDLAVKYLEEIAKRLLMLGKSVQDVFCSDESGNILAEEFILGMNSIGIEEIPKSDLLELLETLQNNKEDRVVCISLRDLEDIMENYGVSAGDSTENDEKIEIESFAGLGEGHVQKVSLLDSTLLELVDS